MIDYDHALIFKLSRMMGFADGTWQSVAFFFGTLFVFLTLVGLFLRWSIKKGYWDW